MRNEKVVITCDVCGEEIELPAGMRDHWKRNVTVLVMNHDAKTFGYESLGMDLCPACFGRTVTLQRVDSTKVTYGADGNTFIDKETVEGKLEWIEDAASHEQAG